MRLFITEHDENRTMPPLEVQIIAFGEKSMPLYVGTKNIRVQADEDCLMSMDGEHWWRLAADVPEWFVVTKDSPRPSIWVKEEPQE